MRAHLLHLYGTLAAEVIAPAAEDPTLLEPLHPDGPDLAAQATYAEASEWARNAEDVIRRRTTLFYRGLGDASVTQRIDALLRANRPSYNL